MRIPLMVALIAFFASAGNEVQAQSAPQGGMTPNPPAAIAPPPADPSTSPTTDATAPVAMEKALPGSTPAASENTASDSPQSPEAKTTGAKTAGPMVEPAAPAKDAARAPSADKDASGSEATVKPEESTTATPTGNTPAKDAQNAKADGPHSPSEEQPPPPSQAAAQSPATAVTTPAAAAAPDSPPQAPASAAAPAREMPDAASTAAPAAPPAAAIEPPKPRLAVDSGSGAFASAYRSAVLQPFAKEAGIEVVAQTADDAASADVVVISRDELDRGCKSGALLSFATAEIMPTSAAAPEEDGALQRMRGAHSDCGIPWLSWSRVFVYDPTHFEKRAPSSIADMFNVKRFPGKRALPANGRGLFEMLLAADGVAADEIYVTLESLNGVQRAMRKLKSLSGNIVWYDRMGEAIGLIRDGKAEIAMTSNTHAFIERARSGPLEIVWDGQVLSADYLAIAKTARERDRALALVTFAGAPEQVAKIAAQLPYGPMSSAALRLASHHAVTGQELAPFLPTAPANLQKAIRFDPEWWAVNGERLQDALKTEIHGPPPPSRP